MQTQMNPKKHMQGYEWRTHEKHEIIKLFDDKFCEQLKIEEYLKTTSEL